MKDCHTYFSEQKGTKHWGGLTNSCEKKGGEKQRRKEKIYPFECRVPKNNKEIKKLSSAISVNRGKQ